MRPEKQAERRRDIEAAAYALLAEKGYRGTSMLAIAKRAGASNETLYKWYGSKHDLFRSMVKANAREVTEALHDGMGGGGNPREILCKIGPRLLRLLLSEKAVALNRAAVADASESGVLGRTLAEAGRETVAPLIAETFGRARTDGILDYAERDDIAGTYIGLLIGDLQIRRVIGVLDPLSDREIQERSDRAMRMIEGIFGSR